MIAQLLFYIPTDEVDVLDLVALESAPDFDETAGSPVSIAIGHPTDNLAVPLEVRRLLLEWATSMAVLQIEVRPAQSIDRFVLCDTEGTEVVIEVTPTGR